MARRIVTARGGFFFETDGQKYITKNLFQKMVDQIYSEIIGAIAIYIPPEYNTTISRYAQLAFVLHQLEDDEVQNLEEK